MDSIDFFHLYRQLLALVCGIYAVIQTLFVLQRWLQPPAGEHRAQAMLRRYALTLFWRTRWQVFGLDILIIIFLMMLILWLFKLHH
ncbi:MAG: hypothetical protein HJJLKODD_02844 [Phycisphaerae bacterium]|nr:hypothetical protein [Phycisphaerae bacterium]